jgi:hypothetical protein
MVKEFNDECHADKSKKSAEPEQMMPARNESEGG